MPVYFTSDPHLGHKNIPKFRKWVKTVEESDEMYLSNWKEKITKRDIIFLLGDVAFTKETLVKLGELPGRKILIKGNHDDFVKTEAQLEVFEEIHGLFKYKEFWLSHCPIHPSEMRKRRANIHGHIHNSIITKGIFKKPDKKYVNACIDWLYPRTGKMFISLEEVRAKFI